MELQRRHREKFAICTLHCNPLPDDGGRGGREEASTNFVNFADKLAALPIIYPDLVCESKNVSAIYYQPLLCSFDLSNFALSAFRELLLLARVWFRENGGGGRLSTERRCRGDADRLRHCHVLLRGAPRVSGARLLRPSCQLFARGYAVQ